MLNHFRQRSPKMQNFATSWGHRAAKMNPMNKIFSSKLNSNVFLHPQKILGPIDFHRSLHNFFAEKKPISGNVQATLENRLNLFLVHFFPSEILQKVRKNDFWAIFSIFSKFSKVHFFPSEILQKVRKSGFWAIFLIFSKFSKVHFFPS